MEFLVRYFDSFDGREREITVDGGTEADALKFAADVYGAKEPNIREVRRINENGDWD